jgi:RNA polymerase sigma-70 factor (ECF subfamily)
MPSDPRTDAELIDLCSNAAGPAAMEAFESLYRRHRPWVLRVATRFAGDRDLALDALQETFIWLLRQFPPVGAGLTLTGRLPALLYPVARHCAVDARQSARRAPTGVERREESPLPAADPHGDLGAVLASLTHEQREALVLREIDGFTLGEIAEVLDIPLDTVESRIHIAELSDALIDALRRREAAPIRVPRVVDAAILRQARSHFARRERAYLPPLRYYWASAAAAAAIVIAVFALATFRHDTPPAARITDDVDGSGQVDVLDAFALARRDAPHPDSATQTRIEALLARIVALPPAKEPGS